MIAGLQARYAEATGIKSLKVRHNNVLGYFVEVTATNAGALAKPPHVEMFVHRQTLANVMRFSTLELGELEARITTAADRALALELDIFAELAERRACRAGAARCRERRVSPSSITTPASPSLPSSRTMCGPKVDESQVFAIVEGRHPMVEQTLARGDGANFVGNDCRLGGKSKDTGTRILVVTGPNMAGKSTFLRQNALIVVLAQLGSFVPAQVGPYRHRRPPVQPGRRRRRPRPRPLDLHGRDGGDRRHPQSGERRAPSSCSTRSAAAPRPSTASPSPGPRSNICTR